MDSGEQIDNLLDPNALSENVIENVDCKTSANLCRQCVEGCHSYRQSICGRYNLTYLVCVCVISDIGNN